MPNGMWRHVCGGCVVVQGSPQCAVCGTCGVFDGWRLSMWEAARLYQYVYGLSPMGPHRALADSVFAGMRDRCARCGGGKILTLDEETWRDCPACEGTGGVWNRPPDEVAAVRRQVVAQWPGAASLWPAR